MNDNICFFAGHRDAPPEIFSDLRRSVEMCITQYGVTEFLVGSYGNFDKLAAKAVIAAKSEHAVKLTLLLSYHPSKRPIPLPEGFDGTLYPEGLGNVPYRFAISRANRYAVNISRCLICYVRHFGNSRELTEYARRKKLHIMEL